MAAGWKEIGNLKGPKGDTGDRGPKGDTGLAGKSTRIANIDVQSGSDVAFSALAPSDNIAVGDTIVDANGEIYTIASINAQAATAHVGDVIHGVNLKGPKGDPGEKGADGTNGKDGTSVNILGSKDSADALPTEGNTKGDGWLVNGELHVWDGDSWNNVGSIKGPKGDTGDPGPKGNPGEKGETGAGTSFGSGAPTVAGKVGALYLDTDTMTMYGYAEEA